MANLERTHGESGVAPTVTYKTWCAMHERIAKPGYQSLGVVVCEEWRTYEPFRDYAVAHLGDRPPGHSLDRIDNSRGYEPGNVRWATPTTQQRNTRSTRMLVVDGHAKPLVEWAEILGVNPAVIRERLKDGWSPERAVTAPLFTQRKVRRDAGLKRPKKSKPTSI
jgi:hypothetical protein